MTLCDRMFEKFDALIGEDDKISKDDLMIILKEELSDVSVFDLMIISAEIIENNKYVKHDSYTLPLDKYSLKQCVDYAKFIINTTEEYIKLYDIDQTVGGYIDVLVVQPTGTFYYDKK